MDNMEIQMLPPSSIDSFDRQKPPLEQFRTAPPVFAAAMIVRHEVFVEEQNVPADCELDQDDPRCCHWVAVVPSEQENATPLGEILGTIRLVPYPQPPHPVSGDVYATVGGVYGLQGRWKRQTGGPDDELVPASALSAEVTSHSSTILHDGREPYVKLGRLAVRKPYRGKGLAQKLVGAALEWMRCHPGFFDGQEPDGQLFRGLVCVHAQVQAAGFWQRMGFTVDEAMGQWWEEGMAHVGMFKRLDVTGR